MADCSSSRCCRCCCKKDSNNNSNNSNEDLTTPVANVALTPFSVIAATCLQVALTTNAADDKALAFNVVCASIVATAGMLIAVFLVIARSFMLLPQPLPQHQPLQQKNRLLNILKELLLLTPQPEISEKERVRIARMMLRCLWFSISFMTTGLLCRVLNKQLKVRDEVSGSLTVLVWIIFVWSSVGAPLPKFNVYVRKTGSLLTTMFPILLLAAYGVLFFTRTLGR